MRKILFTIIILFSFFHIGAQVNPELKVLQYKVIIERTVYHKINYNCYKYVRPTLNEFNPDIYIECLDESFSDPLKLNFCKVIDQTNQAQTGDKLHLEIIKNDIPVIIETPLADLPKGATKTILDTISIYDPKFPISRIISNVIHKDILPLSYYRINRTEFDRIFHDIPMLNSTFVPSSDIYDESKSVSYDLYQDAFGDYETRYSISTRVRVIPNLDPTYTLPSHDKISITSTGFPASPGQIVWEFKDVSSESWKTIPSNYISGSNIEVSGVDILLSDYLALLNSTILFRARSTGTRDTSNIVPFTLRLSSPHISEVAPIHLDCYDRNEGSFKIRFDRPLLIGEKLNVLLYDTVNRINYSALNISSLDDNNTYTWKNELGAGQYTISLLGKYAKGIEYDLDVNNRDKSVKLYKALNTINFTDGFFTPDSDEFNAVTDFTGYAQATYTGSINHIAFRELTQPQKIKFYATVENNIFCKGSASGVVTLSAIGGKRHYKYSLKHNNSEEFTPWQSFDNDNLVLFNYYTSNNSTSYVAEYRVIQKLSNLKAGKYTLRIRDAVDCFVKDSLGNEATLSFEIKEPEKGLTVDLFEVSPITAYNASNGAIKLHISGGTPFTTTGDVQQFPYKVEWRDSASNQLISNFQQSYTGEVYETSINNLGDGTYKLLVYDKSFNVSDPTHPHNTGCYLDMQVPVQKPKPLSVYIDQKTGISCHNNADGQLLAKASGGIPIDYKAYNFKWFKINGETATLLTATDSILNDAATSTYRVEVSDKYDNKVFSEAFTLTQPEPLHLELSSLPASCYSSFNGSMTVKVTGGTPFTNSSKPYVYEWSNGAKTAIVDKVAGGNYLVVVRDSMSCIARDTVSVTSPVQVITSSKVQPITCFNKNDGQISVHASGGTAPYTYQWSNGATTASISNLAPGRYWYTVNDVNGCFDTDTLVLDQPDNLLLDLGTDRKICAGQTIRFNAAVPDTAVLSYQWQGDNGFTANTAKVGIQLAGTYTVSVANRRGCILRDTVILTSLPDSIKADFIVSTQAFANESVHFINISRPRADSVKWMIPQTGNAIRIVQQNNDKCELVFADTGRYEIAMRTYFANGCQEDSTKTINVINRMGTVNAGNQLNTYLKTIGVYPNPNNGQFTVKLVFSEPTVARLRLLNTFNNMVADDRQVQGTNEYTLSYNLGSNLVNGLYLLVIDTPKGSFVFKVDILK